MESAFGIIAEPNRRAILSLLASSERSVSEIEHQLRMPQPSLGTTLATLAEREGLVLAQVGRGFVLDILIAHSCREVGAVLISANRRDLERISRVFSFDFVAPYPALT